MRRGGSPVYGSFFGQSSFASHALAYESNLVVVGDHVDLSVAAPLGCGVQTGAGAVLNVLRPANDASLVVFGAGAVGLSAVMAAKAAGVGTIIAVDPVAGRRQIAAELGATATVDPASDDVVDAIRQLTGAGATHALDTTAIGAVINQAIDALAPLRHAGARGRGHAGGRDQRPERHRRRQDDPRRHRGRRGAADSSSRSCSSSTPRGGCRSRS